MIGTPNNNKRVYPITVVFDIPGVLTINYSEDYKYASYSDSFVKTIHNRGHKLYVIRKTGFKDVIIGDTFYKQLHWTNIGEKRFYKTPTKADKTGMAIVRDKKIIFYSMPGIPEGFGERKVLIEKILTRKNFITRFYSKNF
jgi:hypothetical protein